MPWYAAKPHSTVWGWHWKMNTFDPEKTTNGKQQIASHYRPLIGPYDQFRVAIRNSIDAMLYRATAPADAVTEAATETTDALVRYDEENF